MAAALMGGTTVAGATEVRPEWGRGQVAEEGGRCTARSIFLPRSSDSAPSTCKHAGAA